LDDVQAIPTLSVVIPCYNAERYIAATIESVLAQGHAALEIIVVDDGSSDGSVALVRAAFPQVRVEQQANAGVAAARNRGIALARGEWIAFVDADDIWLPGKLEAQFALMAATPGCRMSYTAWHVWPCQEALPDSATVEQLRREDGQPRWNGASGWIYPELLLDCWVWTSTVLAQRALFDEVGVFDTSLRIGEDYDLWLRLSRVTPIVRVARPLALYRIHPASITKSMPTENYRARVIGGALARWGLASPDGRRADGGAVRRMLAKTWSDHAGARLDGGDAAGARRAGWAALRTDPGHAPGWKVLLKSVLKAALPLEAKEKN
jgi:glycosyltransferase involved in cell wall biosynthesis